MSDFDFRERNLIINAAAQDALSPRERFLAAARCQPLDRPPVWIMRQAGRYLPEYRALKEKYSFVQMVRTPELATEVTLQPLRRFPLDAAILFSDILIIPEALGQPYHFRDKGGIGMDFALESVAQIEALAPADVIADKLSYVDAALRLCRKALGSANGDALTGTGGESLTGTGEKALLGFAGSPWTLAAYMVQGGSSADFPRLKALVYEQPKVFHALMEKLSDAVANLLNMKIAAGVDVVQIFDSWAALCPGREYHELSLRWIGRIIEQLPKDFPVIVFAKGMATHAADIAATGAKVIGLDWSADIAATAAALPHNVAVQGNLDPTLLSFATPQVVREKVRSVIDALGQRPGHIFNLGHGILPDASIEAVAALVDEVQRPR